MKKLQIVIALLLAFVLSGCADMYIPQDNNNPSTPSEKEHVTDKLVVHFLDVGQADCTVIQLPKGDVLMIDAGNNDDSKLICNYLDSLEIDTIDYLVGSHPHEDHIGSLDVVINSYDVINLYMPDAKADTKTYRDVIVATEKKNVNIISTSAGMTIYSDEYLKIETLAPVKNYSDLNNASIVVRLTYKDSSFLFPADAEELSENDITGDVSADVLKVGHHGSSTSTSAKFLAKVDPMYAVISCGKGNSYGHPHYETLEKLEDDDITIYRTDEEGTLICTTTGGGPADYKWETK